MARGTRRRARPRLGGSAAVIEDRSYLWLWRTQATQRVFERLPESQRLLVRYEDLRADTARELERIHRWLGAPIDALTALQTADRLSFERLPPHLRGPGRFARSATPGSWRTNLTPADQQLMEAVMADKLEALGYGI